MRSLRQIRATDPSALALAIVAVRVSRVNQATRRGAQPGRPRERAQQREIVKAALQHAEQAGEDWELNRLPFQWAADGNRDWEALVSDIYRVDNAIRGSVLTNVAATRRS